MNLSRNRYKSNLELSELFYRRGFMKFDKIIHKTLDEESVDYGFIFGNNKIVFIKAGAGGGLPGYQDKYLWHR